MKITITFDSLEEFKKHIIGVPEAAPAQKAPEAPQSDEEPKPKKNPKKAEKPQEEDAGQPDEAPAPEVSEDTPSYRRAARRGGSTAPAPSPSRPSSRPQAPAPTLTRAPWPTRSPS